MVTRMSMPNFPTLTRDNAYMLAISALRMILERESVAGEPTLDDVRTLFPAFASHHAETALRDIRQRFDDSSWAGEHPLSAELHTLISELEDMRGRDRDAGPFQVDVPTGAFQRLMLAGVHYALGRMTYIVSVQCGLTAAYAQSGHLTEETIAQMIEMIEERKARHDTSDSPAGLAGSGALGMDCDYDSWAGLLHDLGASETPMTEGAPR